VPVSSSPIARNPPVPTACPTATGRPPSSPEREAYTNPAAAVVTGLPDEYYKKTMDLLKALHPSVRSGQPTC
jgi:hypothetical protein